MRRRDLVFGGVVLPFLGDLLWERAAVGADAPPETVLPDGAMFDAATVRQLARQLAQKPYKAPDVSLPDALKNLTYDQYRMIRFVAEKALWQGENLPFQAQFFHRGFYYNNRVDVFQVDQGKSVRIHYSPSLFSFGEVAPPDPHVDLGFAGFRLHAPINRPDYFDEVAVFLGASYFRAIAKNQVYGLSSRGLGINTGDAKGEQFPFFKSFWIERPQPGTASIVVHALLDCESAAGAYRFTIRPGGTTVFDVEMVLYPRAQITQAGIASLTSMFLFDANDRRGVDDFRPAVHDSDGLMIHNGHGEQLWRPLTNPLDLQVSTFADVNPRGFGLLQRQRDFRIYEDLEAHYERRPSLWIEPIGDWGDGQVELIEIPSKEEIHDNIVAFWRPREPLREKGEYQFTYRMHWGAENPRPVPLAQVITTRVGAGPRPDTRLFVLDLAGETLKNLDATSGNIRGVVSAGTGKLDNIVAQPNPEAGGWRLSFELAPEKNNLVELRAQLKRDQEPLSEVWVYRWTP